MAKQSITVLKQWFENGDYPTQQQFWDWMDSYFHKDESIGMSTIEGLTEVLQQLSDAIGQGSNNNSQGPIVLTGVPSFAVPARTLIDKIIIEEAAQINFVVTDGVDALLDATVSGTVVFSNFDYYKAIDTTIFFGGIHGNTIISIYTR